MNLTDNVCQWVLASLPYETRTSRNVGFQRADSTGQGNTF